MINTIDVIDEIKELCKTIEEVHPDPFLACGGRIAFYSEVKNIIDSLQKVTDTIPIPLAAIKYAKIASLVGDGHTKVRIPRKSSDYDMIPIYCRVFDGLLFITSVIGKEYSELLGCRLVSILNIPLEETVKMFKDFVAHDNSIHQLWDGSFLACCRFFIETILGRSCYNDELIPVELEQNGKKITRFLPLVVDSENIIQDNCNKHNILWDDYNFCATALHNISDTGIAIIKIKDCLNYRENFEDWLSNPSERNRIIEDLQKQYNNTSTDSEYLLSLLPSANELFSTFIHKAKVSNTKYLIIDLSDNGGGNSFVVPILACSLFGSNAALEVISTPFTNKISNSLLEQRTVPKKLLIDWQKNSTSLPGGYSFFNSETSRKIDQATLEHYLSVSKEFSYAFSHSVDQLNSFVKIFTIVDCATYSAGFHLAMMLKKFGSIIIGTIPSQAPKSFMDSLSFKLSNSNIHYKVSYSTQNFSNLCKSNEFLTPDIIISAKSMLEFGTDSEAFLFASLKEIQRYFL